ncbi:hypothetical protein [Paludifilum halophilum]|uniref:Uncharacterized protein n=1 Tax=Paludifilum halophilum TaxID=1642702 RepID=A0A235BBJ5_9BACL|nr:hypothetical protein [Paludifilum halophilum]OYD08935.1 hypothetical protein CHM34_03925 [Paludifilum halophilum]
MRQSWLRAMVRKEEALARLMESQAEISARVAQWLEQSGRSREEQIDAGLKLCSQLSGLMQRGLEMTEKRYGWVDMEERNPVDNSEGS